MGSDGLHVIFGSGQVGRSLAVCLLDLGLPVRVVSQHPPLDLPDRLDWRAADASDPEAAIDAAKGATVVYQCLSVPYPQWAQRFPALQRGVLTAAGHADALLVTLENLYGYGPTRGAPMTEDLPLAAGTLNGRIRAAMTRELLAAARAGQVRIAIGRASDVFGPGVTGAALGEWVFGRAVAGRPARFIGNPGLPHTYSYLPDIAAGLATLGTDERAIGQVWHLPGPETTCTRRILALIAAELGHPVPIRSVPTPLVRALGRVNPGMRALAETAYRFEQPFILDTTRYRIAFGPAGTPLATALADTLAWYRHRMTRR